MTNVWPRLPNSKALELYEVLRGVASLARLRAESSLSHKSAAAVAVGGPVVTERVIADLQHEIRRLAEDHGWPESISRGEVSSFDQPCSLTLHNLMGIVPADASHEGVWSFLSLVVLPDIAKWRFPDAALHRMIGTPRNVFRRLWWRVETLGQDALTGPQALGEDELVQIMERPSLSGNAELSRMIATEVMYSSGVEVARSELMRDLTKRVLRTMPVICFESLQEDELHDVIAKSCEVSVKNLQTLRSNVG